MGNGKRIRFWEDAWCDDVALAHHFEDLFRISTTSNASIAEVFVPQSDLAPHGWDLVFIEICMIGNSRTMQT